MKQMSTSGFTDYTLLLDKKEVFSQKRAACYAALFKNDFNIKYNIVRLYGLDCAQTIEYKDFFLQYVIDMFDLEGSFNKEYFEFKSFGHKYKDLIVMVICRLLWEYICGSRTLDSIESLFKPLKKGKSRYKNKLKRFCDFYSKIQINGNYVSDGHCPNPIKVKIKSTKDFKNIKTITSVNQFFYE